ncbi:TIGR04104 family putative zinc finger protein [Peribacillus frigoritolerans]|uniref:TIGR04104 family putative zinc finger protein n=1 Tax=Peribacillus frigoritolerans TaxID=450367 RepID=UPI0018D33C12
MELSGQVSLGINDIICNIDLIERRLLHMPICQHCGYKWGWIEAFLKMFTLKKKLRCPSCDSSQYVSKKSRKLLSLLIFISLLFVPLVSFGVPKGYVLAFEIVAYALVIILMPFIYKLSNKDEPMW